MATTENSGLIIDALKRTDPILAIALDADNTLSSTIIERGARVKLYRDYERGDHRANMTKQMKKMLRLVEDDTGLTELNVNYCKVIVDKMAGRLFVSNITVDNESDDAKQWLNNILAYQDFDAQQNEWFRGSIRDGDAYVMVDPKTMRWVAEPSYDGYKGVMAFYDPISNRALWACKLWSESGEETSGTSMMKIVVYQPGVISYWIGEEGKNEVKPDDRISTDETSELVNYVPWPLDKLPLVQFANQKDSYTSYGESELRVAIPLQDSLNAIQHDKIMASKMTAFQMLWSIGFEIPVDGVVPGAVINLVLKDASGVIITDPTDAQVEFLKSAKVGQFTGADIGQYTNQIEKETQQISQITQTPLYGVTTQGNLSGEALKQLEIGLLGKVERYQRQNVDAIRELIALTAEIQNLFDNDLGNAPDFLQVNVIWRPAEILDVNGRIQTLTALREKAPGLFADKFYIKRVGSLLGLSQDEIESEIEDAQNQFQNRLEGLVGIGGGVPVA